MRDKGRPPGDTVTTLAPRLLEVFRDGNAYNVHELAARTGATVKEVHRVLDYMSLDYPIYESLISKRRVLVYALLQG